MPSEPVRHFNLDLEVNEKIRTALSAGHSVVVLGCKFSGKSRAADKLPRRPGLTVIDIPGESGEEDYKRLLIARNEVSRGRQLAIFMSHWHKDYFRTRSVQQNGRRSGVFDSKSFPHKEILLSVSREEAFGNTKVGRGSHDDNCFLREYLRQYCGASGGDFIFQNLDLDIELEQMILKGTRYEQRGYETFVPPLIRVHAEVLCKNRSIEAAIARKDPQMVKEGFAQVRGLLERRNEETSFLHTVFGLDSSWFAATKGLGFETAMHVVKETLKAVLPFGSEILALAGLGIAQGLWRRAKGGKASVLEGLAVAGNLWKKMSEEEQRFLCYRLERARKLEPDTTFISLQNLFDPSSRIQKHLEDQINEHADEIWEALQKAPEAKVLVDRMDWFERRLTALEQDVAHLKAEAAQQRLEGSVELTPSNVSGRLGVNEEYVVGLGSGEADEKIRRTAREIISKAGSGPVIISGEPGAGKTTLLYLISKELLDGNRKVRLIENMNAFALTRESSEARPEEYLVFDATKEGTREFLGKLHPYVNAKSRPARVIAAVRSDHLYDYLSATEHSSREVFQRITHPLAYSRDTLEGIVDRWAGTSSSSAPTWSKTRRAILERCEGSPFYISQALAFLTSKGFSEDARKSLPNGVRGLVAEILDDLSQNDSRQLVAYYVISRYDHLPKTLVEAMRGKSALAFDVRRKFYIEVGHEIRAHSWYRDVFQEIVAQVREGEDDPLANRLKEGIEDSKQLFLGLGGAGLENGTLEADWLQADVEERLKAITWGLLIRVFRAQLSIDPYIAQPEVGKGFDERLHGVLLGFALHEVFADISYPEPTPKKLMWMSARYLPRLMFSPVVQELEKVILGKGGPTPSVEWLVSLQNRTNSAVDERCIALVTWALISMGHIGIDREDHGEKADLFRLLQMYDRELAEYDWAIELNPTDPSYHNYKGTALVELGRLEMAVKEFEEAIQLNPSHPDSHNHKGLALFKLGQDEEALVEFEKAIQLKPGDLRYHSNKGAALFKLGRLDMAVKEFEEAIQLNPSHPDSHSNKGVALVELGRFEAALGEYDRAIQLNPNDPHYHGKKGDGLFRLGRFEAALGEYDRAIQLNPNDPDYHGNKGDALSKLGRDEEALVEFEKAQRLRAGH